MPTIAIIHEYGGHGVDVKLISKFNPGPASVFWSKGYNSFVMVDDPNGAWMTPDNQRVALVAINGIGEIRWKVDRSLFGEEGAVAHWYLTPVTQ